MSILVLSFTKNEISIQAKKINEKIKSICKDHAQRIMQEYLRGTAYNITYWNDDLKA